MDATADTNLVARRPAGDRLMDLDELVTLTGMNRASVYSLKCRGELGFPVVQIDRRLRFWQSDVMAWLEANTQNPKGRALAAT